MPINLKSFSLGIKPNDNASGLVFLPKNLLLTQPTLVDDYEVDAEWVVSGAGATKLVDYTHYKSGTRSQGFVTASGGSGAITKDLGGPTDFSNKKRLSSWCYIDNPDPINDELNINILIRLSTVPNFSVSRSLSIGSERLIHGWQHLQVPILSLIGTDDLTQIRYIQHTCSMDSGKTGTLAFDLFEWGHVGIPAIMLFFDDGLISTYNDVYPLLSAHNISASLAAWTNKIGTAGYMTWAQLRELDAAGWTIFNHTSDHTTLTTLSEADQETKISDGKTALVSNQLSRCADYLAFPNGSYNGDTFTAMENLNVLIGRTANSFTGAGMRECYLPVYDNKVVVSRFVGSTQTPQDVENYIDDVISKGIIASIYQHNIGGTGEMSLADFTTVINYLVDKAKSGLIFPITLDDFYKLQSGSINVLKVI